MNESPVEVSLVFPAYQEADNLRLLLPQVRAVLGALAPSFEVVVVDTPTPLDATPEVCAANGARYVSREGGMAYGNAIRTALRHVRGKHVFLMDADGSHSPDFLPELWRYRENHDLVIASRYVPGGRTENPAVLVWMSLMVNVVFRFVLNLNCHDVSNSFRLYDGDRLRELSLECDNFDVVEEILVKMNRRDRPLRLKEVPFVFQKRQAGKTKRKLLVFVFGYLATLIRLHRLKRRANH